MVDLNPSCYNYIKGKQPKYNSYMIGNKFKNISQQYASEEHSFQI